MKKWTDEENAWLIENYGFATKSQIMERFPDRIYQGILTHANSLGLRRVKREGKIFYDEDLEWLRDNYSVLSFEEVLAHFAGVATYSQIISVASKIGVKRPENDYAEDELEMIRKYYKSCKSVQEFQAKYLPNRTASGIHAKAQRMGLFKREDWTEEEDKVLIDNYDKMFRWQLCELFPQRTKNSVFNRIISLGLSGGQGYAYRKEDDDFIIKNYETMSDEEIGKVLHRATKSIKQRRNDLGYHRKNFDEATNYINLNHFLSRQDAEWRKMAEIACDKKCLLSDDEYEDVHHLYSRNLMVSEIGEYFKLSDDFDINACSKELKEQIILKYREIEDLHGLGICLTEKIHMKFHSLYGFGNNTPQQFLLFVSNFFPEKLEIVKKYIKTTN